MAAGIAIENARLHQRVQDVAAFDETGSAGPDLHDTVIQRLFAVGLTLQSMAARASDDTAKRLDAAVAEIDHIIHQVRSTIYELGMNDESRGTRDDVITLVRELDPVVGFEIHVSSTARLTPSFPTRWPSVS